MQVAQRRKLLDYLKSKDEGRYNALIAASGPASLIGDDPSDWNARAARRGRFALHSREA